MTEWLGIALREMAKNFTAKQAREIASKPLESVLEDIRNAAEKGRTEVSLWVEASPPLIRRLRELGYRVEFNDMGNVWVSWAEDKPSEGK
jgi:hypothetical protein